MLGIGMDFAQQVRAARSIKDWTQPQLADLTGLSVPTIQKIENEEGATTVNNTTVKKVIRVFENEGLIFTSNGVELRKEKITYLSGIGWYENLLEDVIRDAKLGYVKELLIMYGDDRLSPVPVVKLYQEIRKMGVKMRQLVEDGNEYLQGPIDEYRYVPKEHFYNWVTVIYGTKVAISIDNNRGCSIVEDINNAQSQRNTFNVLFDALAKPERREADVYFDE